LPTSYRPRLRITAGGLHSLQTITPDGEKRFHPGGRIRAAITPLANKRGNRIVVVCEELRDHGASIHETTGDAVAVSDQQTDSTGGADACARIMRT
jgi:putative DNA primase/helicase